MSVVARLLTHKDETISNLCCEAFKRLYADDKLGESSLEAVRLTSKLVKAQGNQVPPKVLETFLSLKISEASLKMEEQQKKNSKQIQKEMKMMSRKEKKWKKKMAKLEKELLETEAEESKEKKTHFHTEILNHVFVTYFRILKSENPSSLLLTPVLKGLSKFAHLINIEFFDDLISIICKMLDSSNLSDIQTFHCLHTVFTILSGEGQALNIDPQHFYVHLYKNLLQQSLVKDDSVTQALLMCIDIMILKRKKKLTFRRMLALIKRISTMSLYQAHNGALSFLACVKLMLQSSRMHDVIVDTEEGHGSGMFMPEIEDPEYCNANATVLWEVCNLRCHYHPAVRKYALHIALKCPMQGEGQLSVELSKKSPLEILEEFSMKNMEFNPPLTSLSEMGLKVGKKRKMHPFSYSSANLMSAAKSIYQEKENVELDFFQHLDRDRLHLLHSAQSLNV